MSGNIPPPPPPEEKPGLTSVGPGPVSNLALKQIRGSSSVTHSVSAHLVYPKSLGRPANLVLAKGTDLEIYEVAYNGPLDGDQRLATMETSKLISLESLSLYGVIESIAVIQPHQGTLGLEQGRDSLLIAFRDAKAVVCSWDVRTGALAVTSLHSWEDQSDLTDGRTSFPRPPLARADPQGRCSGVLIFQNRLAILPPASLEDDEPGHASPSEQCKDATLAPSLTPAAAVSSSYTLHLGKKPFLIHEPRDFAFIGGSSGPVALVLHEAQPAWTGSYHERKDTCVVTAISIGGGKDRSHPVLWTCRALPSDAFALFPVPEPLGGALIATPDMLLYRSHSQHMAGASVLPGVILNSKCLPAGNNPKPRLPAHLNPKMTPAQIQAAAMFFGNQEDPFAPLTAEEEAQVKAAALKIPPDSTPECLRECTRAPPDVDIVVDSPEAWAWLDASRLLVATSSGQAVMVSLVGEARNIRSLQAAKVAVLPTSPSACCTLALAPPIKLYPGPGESRPPATAGLVFAGASAGDSLLLRYALQSEEEGAGEEDKGEGPPSKKQKTEGDEEEKPAKAEEPEEDDALAIYEMALGTSGGGLSKPRVVKCRLKPVDRLKGWGTVRDACLGDLTATLSSKALQDRLQEDATLRQGVYSVLGGPRGGAIGLTRTSLVPEPLGLDLPLPGIDGLWSFPLASASTPLLATSAARARGQGEPDEDELLDFGTMEEEEYGGTGPNANESTSSPLPTFEARDDLLPSEQHALSDPSWRHGLLVMAWRKGGQQQLRAFDIRETAGFKDVTETFALPTNARTVFLGSFGAGRLVLHATESTLRTYQIDGSEFQAIPGKELFLSSGGTAGAAASTAGPAHDGESSSPQQAIAQVVIFEPFVLVLGSRGSTALLHICPSDLKLQRTRHFEGDRYCAAAALRGPQAVFGDGDEAASCSYLALARSGPSGDVELWRLRPQADAAPEPLGTFRGMGLGGQSFAATSTVPFAAAVQDPHRNHQPTKDRPSSSNSPPSSTLRSLCFSAFGDASVASPTYHTAPEFLQGSRHPATFLTTVSMDGVVSVFRLTPSVGFEYERTVLARRQFTLLVGPGGEGHASLAWVRPFHRLRAGGRRGLLHEGLFIGGPRPHWLLYNGRGALVAHATHSEGPVFAWCEVNCSALPAAALASVDKARCVRFHQLPPHPWDLLASQGAVSYQVPLDPKPVVPVPTIPMKVAYYPEGRLLCLGVIKKGDVARLLPRVDEEATARGMEAGREPKQNVAYLTAQTVLQEGQREDVHEFQLFDVASGAVVFREPMSPLERIASVAAVRLHNKQENRTQPLIAVGTVRPLGTDVYPMGRLLLYEALQTPGVDGGDPTWTVRRLAEWENLHGFTALQEVDGLLLTATGTLQLNCNTVKFFQWTGSELQEGSFYNPDKPRYMAPTYVSKLAVIRPNDGIPIKSTAATQGVGALADPASIYFSLMADVMGSLHVLCLPLGHMGRVVLTEFHDHAIAETLTCEALADNRIPNSTSFLAADRAGCLRVHRPFQANTLLLQGATYLGRTIIAMDRWRRAGRSSVLLVASDGALSLGTLLPEDQAHVLRTLQEHLGQGKAFAPPLGLNPRSFHGRFDDISTFDGGMKRCWATVKRLQRKVPPPESVLDLGLIEQFASLSRSRQEVAVAGMQDVKRRDLLLAIASALSLM